MPKTGGPGFGLFAALVALCLFGPGQAQAGPEAEAEAVFERARQHFAAGRYREAAVALDRVFTLQPQPMVLRYLGECHLRLGEDEKALFYFTQYLRLDPEAPDRDAVQKAMTEARERLKQAAAPSKPAPPPTGPPVGKPSDRLPPVEKPPVEKGLPVDGPGMRLSVEGILPALTDAKRSRTPSPSPAPADPEAEARAAFAKAREHFQAGRALQAAIELERAYALRPRPQLLRYLGDSYARQKDHEQAVSAYVRYLRAMPMATDGEAVRTALAREQALLEQQRKKEFAGKRVPERLMPTGSDEENPMDARTPKGPAARTGGPSQARVEAWPRWSDGPLEEPPPRRVTVMGVSKWVSGGLGLVGLGLGVAFNRLAMSEADALRSAVQTACPAEDAICAGNPGLTRPVAPYAKAHLEMELAVERYNQLAVTSFVVGGVLCATSALLFVLDRKAPGPERPRPSSPHLTVSPVFQAREVGLLGEVRF